MTAVLAVATSLALASVGPPPVTAATAPDPPPARAVAVGDSTRSPRPPRISLRILPAAPHAGRRFTARGRLRGHVRRPVTLQMRVGPSSPWVRVGASRSRRDGTYVIVSRPLHRSGTVTFRARAPAVTVHSRRYRAVRSRHVTRRLVDRFPGAFHQVSRQAAPWRFARNAFQGAVVASDANDVVVYAMTTHPSSSSPLSWFVEDVTRGTTRRLDRDIHGVLDLSGDGTQLLYRPTSATVPAGTPGQLTLLDLTSGDTTDVPLPPRSVLDGAVLSGDGDTVAYSVTEVLEPRGTGTRLMVWDRSSGSLTEAPHAFADGPDEMQSQPGLSADGRVVSYASRRRVAGNDVQVVVVWDRVAGTLDRLTGDEEFLSARTSLSPDGQALVLSTYVFADATDVAPGKGTLTLFDLRSGQRLGVASGTFENQWRFDHPTVSAGGRHVAYGSDRTDLLAGSDTSAYDDLFVWDRDTGATTRLTNTPPDGLRVRQISADGGSILVDSTVRLAASDTDSGGSGSDVFLWRAPPPRSVPG